MCARYTLGNVSGVPLRFQAVAEQLELTPRYNIAPSQFVPVIVPANGGRAIHLQRFGLIPAWSKDGPPKFATINARGEDIEAKATYRRPFQRQRCLIPADGFYEWRTEGKAKIPLHIRLRDGGLFAFAGVYDVWREPSSDERVESFSIVTTTPNDLLKTIHNRMPVILPAEAEDFWLDPDNRDIAGLKSLLRPYPAEEMEAYEVSKAVSRPGNEGPALIAPAGRE